MEVAKTANEEDGMDHGETQTETEQLQEETVKGG
jgi:hypothetical protein